MNNGIFSLSVSSEKTHPRTFRLWGIIMPGYQDFYARLWSCRLPGETKKDFAKRAGKDLKTLHNWEKNKHFPTIRDVEELADRLNVNRGWLGFGIGDDKHQEQTMTGEGETVRRST